MIEMPDRVLHAPARLKEACEIVVAVTMVGLTLQRLLIRCNRFIEAIAVLEQHSKIEEKSCACPACCNPVAVYEFGCRPFARQMQQPPAIDV